MDSFRGGSTLSQVPNDPLPLLLRCRDRQREILDEITKWLAGQHGRISLNNPPSELAHSKRVLSHIADLISVTSEIVALAELIKEPS